VYDADSRAKALMTTDQILISRIRKEFGDLSFDDKGNLNRAYLSSEVFANEEKLERLNSMVHPRVGEDYKKWFESFRGSVPYVLKEAALLFESGSFRQLDKVIVIFASREIRIARVLKRDPHRSSAQVENIIMRQLSEEEKMNRADYIITNDESMLLIPQVLSLHQKFLHELY
jgi:dephospho-CoA kinase